MGKRPFQRQPHEKIAIRGEGALKNDTINTSVAVIPGYQLSAINRDRDRTSDIGYRISDMNKPNKDTERSSN